MTKENVQCPFCGFEWKKETMEHFHSPEEYQRYLDRDYVPVSKLKALPFDDWCFCRTCLGLQDLLKEKEKPEE